MRGTLSNKNLFYGVFASLFLILVLLARNAPVNVDEFLHNRHAKHVVNWYKTRGEDKECLKEKPDNLRYYGQSIDNVAALIADKLEVEQVYILRNYIGAIIGGLILLCTGIFIKYLTGSYLWGVMGMLLLFISPRPFGQVLGNLKDLPFALGYIWTCFGLVKFVKELPFPSIKTILFLSFGIAFSNSVRIGGIIFYPILGLFIILWLILNFKKLFIRQHLGKYVKTWSIVILLLVVVGYFGSLVFWPYGLKDPLRNPFTSLSLMKHYSISIKQIFEGDVAWSTHLPWYYILKWLLISIPEVVLATLLCFIIICIRKLKYNLSRIKQDQTIWVLVFCTLFPIVYVVAIKSNLYSGWRQLYFIYPGLIVIGIYGVSKMWDSISNKTMRWGILGLLIILSILPVIHIVKTYPVHYVYFNSLVNKTDSGWSDYEYDYYFHGMKEATSWLFENEDLPENSIIAANSNLSPYFPKESNAKFLYTHFYDHYKYEWNYAILCNNYVHPFQLKNNTWLPEDPLKVFYHNGNPYIIILKWKGEAVKRGMEAYSDRDFTEAKFFFESALKDKPGNLSLMAYLGETYLQLNEYSLLEDLLRKGYQYNPNFEHFLYIDARSYFNRENYSEALNITKKLLKLNPKFTKALPLLKSCYEKTGRDSGDLKIQKI